MAKRKAEEKKVPATAEKDIRHARLELPDEDYERLKRVAKSLGLGVAAYIRQAVMRQLRRDEEEMGS
jgi:predicted DNA-binding protein